MSTPLKTNTMEAKIVKFARNGVQSNTVQPSVDVFVNKRPENVQDLICGKLQYVREDGDYTVYAEQADGCIWVYLTDCNGKVDAGTTHNCVRGNELKVQGCHAFGCQC